MTRRRWIADQYNDTTATLDGAHAAHLAKTLRARLGEQHDVACGDRVFRGVISSVAEDRIVFDLVEEVTPLDSVVPITLVLSVFKFERMEWAIEKCTELNVTSIVPVIARRTEKHLAQAAEKRVERWRRIAVEAAQQSRRVQPPEITAPVKLERALDSVEGTKIVLAETESQLQLLDALRQQDAVLNLSLAIGPEGGWAAEELQTFERASWLSASLGPTILRAETAVSAALAIARAELG